MKDNFFHMLMHVIMAVVIIIAFLIVFWLITPTPTPTLYECPCESEELIKDVVRHTNKDGMKSVTTFVDVKGCLIVND